MKHLNNSWSLTGSRDLGARAAVCERCGTSIRYQYDLLSESGGRLLVGVECAAGLVHDIDARKSRFAFKLRNQILRHCQPGGRFALDASNDREWNISSESSGWAVALDDVDALRDLLADAKRGEIARAS